MSHLPKPKRKCLKERKERYLVIWLKIFLVLTWRRLVTLSDVGVVYIFSYDSTRTPAFQILLRWSKCPFRCNIWKSLEKMTIETRGKLWSYVSRIENLWTLISKGRLYYMNFWWNSSVSGLPVWTFYDMSSGHFITLVWASIPVFYLQAKAKRRWF